MANNESNKQIASNKREGLREFKPGCNVEFGPLPTLHGHKTPPIEDFTPLLLLNQFCSQRAYTTTSRISRRILNDLNYTKVQNSHKICQRKLSIFYTQISLKKFTNYKQMISEFNEQSIFCLFASNELFSYLEICLEGCIYRHQ